MLGVDDGSVDGNLLGTNDGKLDNIKVGDVLGALGLITLGWDDAEVGAEECEGVGADVSAEVGVKVDIGADVGAKVDVDVGVGVDGITDGNVLGDDDGSAHDEHVFLHV